MYRKSKKLLAWSLVVCMILTQMLFTNLAFAATTKTTAFPSNRLAGADRYATAIAISQAEWVTSDYAVLAYGEDFPDALAAAPLAGKYQAPILLTAKDSLNADVLAELKRLQVKNVFIIGGEGVVSKAVADAVTAAGMTTERLFGADRYATALAVANKIGTTTEVVVAYGEGFADALSISSIAAAKGMPILLTDKDAMSADVKAYIGTKKAYVVGGEGVVSAAVFNGLTGAVRLSGADRYQTNLAVLKQFADTLNWKNVFVATGEGFADALAGSALAASVGSGVVLAGSSLNADTAAYLGTKVAKGAVVVAFGGAAVVSDAVVSAVTGGTTTPAVLGVESVTALGLNGIKVVFNQEVDKDSAITRDRYTIDGVVLSANDDLYLASDNKTLYILLDDASEQYKTKLFTVKDKVVLSKDTLTSVPKYEKELTFSDTGVPGIESVKVTGNKKLTVKFTEPVDMADDFSSYGSYFKMDDQYLSSYGFKEATTTVFTATDRFGIQVDLYFDVAIPAGTHTFKTLKGDSNHFADAAGYYIPETDNSITIESVTTAPQVVSVTGETNGIVYVTFDRSMSDDIKDVDLFALNGELPNTPGSASEPDVVPTFNSGTDSKVLKLSFGAGNVNEGANVLTLDNDVKDAWGNKLHADTDQRFSFTASKDTTKPTIVSVVMIDSTTIRVKYSEDVNESYAEEISNYTLKDSSGVTKSIISGIDNASTGTLDTYTITLSSALTGSNYTLKIKNVVDLASPANRMDEYVATVNGIDDVAPSVTAVVAVPNSKKVAVYFTEKMDVATATDKANYAYKDTNNTSKTHALPSSATVTMGDTGKFVTIAFPDGYTVTATVFNPGTPESDYYVQAIRVSNVKDLAGNLLKDISVVADVQPATGVQEGKPTYNDNTFKLFADSNKAWAEFELDQTLSNFDYHEFYIDNRENQAADANSVTPTSGYRSGNKVVLNFATTATKDKVMSFGADARLYTIPSLVSSKNASGVTMTAYSGANSIQVWDDQIAPKWIAENNEYINVTSDVSTWTNAVTLGTTCVVLKFSEALSDEVPGLYKNDFTFTQGGKLLTVTSTIVSGQYLVYVFDQSKNLATTDSTVQMIVTANSTVDIRDKNDSGADDYNLYVPSSTDKQGRTWGN